VLFSCNFYKQHLIVKFNKVFKKKKQIGNNKKNQIIVKGNLKFVNTLGNLDEHYVTSCIYHVSILFFCFRHVRCAQFVFPFYLPCDL
jgi:hypothetical protein